MPSPTGPSPTYPRSLTCNSPTPSTPATFATCAVKATRLGAEVRTRPSRRATTEWSPSAPTTTRALYVARCPLPARATTPMTAPRSQTRASTFAPWQTAAPAPTTTASHPSFMRAPRRSVRYVRPDCGDGRAYERGREVHRVVVEPSPSRREPYRLVTDGIPALESRVTRGALVLALERRAEQ